MNNKINKLLEGTSYARKFGSRGKLQELDGICDTLVAAMGTGGGNVPIITEETMDNINNICGSLRTIDACGDKRVLEIATATAMRGRNNEDGKCEQRLEISDREYANAITTVQKDSLVAEVEKNINENATIIREEPLEREGWHKKMSSEAKIKVIGNYSPSNHDASRIVDKEGLAPTVKENHGTVTATMQNLRIRKLTPLECFRLQGFDDDSFRRAEKVNSNSQLYKQAGNSICVPVIQYILQNLFECGVLNIE